MLILNVYLLLVMLYVYLLLKTINVHMVHQEKGQSSAMGYMSLWVQTWQHVSAPMHQCTDILLRLLLDNAEPAGRACICKYWNVIWEDSHLLRGKGHFSESITGQQMPFVSSQTLQTTSVMDCFVCGDLQAYLENRKKSDEEVVDYSSFLFPCLSSLVNAQDVLEIFFHFPFSWEGDANKSPLPSNTNQLEHY